MAFALTPERETQVNDLIGRYPTRRAALIPVLWVCQRQNGWVSPEVIDYVAARLEISAAAVKGVVTFYTMFQQHPVGENTVWVCRTLSCDLRGGKVLQDHMEERFGCHAGGTSKNGKFSLFKAECLAACGQAPMIQIGDRYYENLDVKKLDEILDAYEKDGAEAAEARFADTAPYNGHLPAPGEPGAPVPEPVGAKGSPRGLTPAAKRERPPRPRPSPRPPRARRPSAASLSSTPPGKP